MIRFMMRMAGIAMEFSISALLISLSLHLLLLLLIINSNHCRSAIEY